MSNAQHADVRASVPVTCPRPCGDLLQGLFVGAFGLLVSDLLTVQSGRVGAAYTLVLRLG